MPSAQRCPKPSVIPAGEVGNPRGSNPFVEAGEEGGSATSGLIYAWRRIITALSSSVRADGPGRALQHISGSLSQPINLSSARR